LSPTENRTTAEIVVIVNEGCLGLSMAWSMDWGIHAQPSNLIVHMGLMVRASRCGDYVRHLGSKAARISLRRLRHEGNYANRRYRVD
jgi:hypothetical protein